MKRLFITLAVVGAGFCCQGQSPADSNQAVVRQPSIFWHNGEWQTYKNGVWSPYGRATKESVETPDRAGGPGVSVGNNDDSWRHGTQMTPARRHIERNRRLRAMENATGAAGADVNLQQSTAQSSQPNISIGQNTIGVGQRNGLGQTTIGIGQPNTGIGPRNDFARQTTPSNKPPAPVRPFPRDPRQ